METELNNLVSRTQAGMQAGMQTAAQIESDKLSEEETEKIGMLIRELITANTNLVIKVATCKCNDKESCKLYREAQKIAEIIDKLNETRS